MLFLSNGKCCRNQFAPIDPILCKMIALVMLVLCMIGMFGNGMVVWIFITTPALRSPSNILVVNLAFSDFIMMTSQTPVMIINAWFETWVLGEFKIFHVCCSEIDGMDDL